MLDFPSWLGHKTVYSLVVTVTTVSSPMHYYMPLAVSRALAMVLGSKFTYYDDMVLVFSETTMSMFNPPAKRVVVLFF
jgi:hypothetical protein